jgi:hypothetical protein
MLCRHLAIVDSALAVAIDEVAQKIKIREMYL